MVVSRPRLDRLFTVAAFFTGTTSANLSANLLQTCIDKCHEEPDLCCGNRLNGEAPNSSNNRLSCANGCEIAYYSENISECKAYCEFGNDASCDYDHPVIQMPFSKCGSCQEGCDGWPPSNACDIGCDKAKDLNEFYNPCFDYPDWEYKGQNGKSCIGWVSEDENERCGYGETKGVHAGKKVWEICPVTCKCAFDTCKPCSSPCADDESFQYQGKPTKTCKGWVKKKKNKRCKLEGVSESCPKTCKTIRNVGSCGDGGNVKEVCLQNKWQNVGCFEDSYFRVIAGFGPADVIRGLDIFGWSYYIRAFDMVRDTPVKELGWGQWTKGDLPGGGQSQEVCGRHPNSFVCNLNNPPSDDEMDGEFQHCGSTDLDEMEKCTAGCCGDNNKCGIGGGNAIEGGMGYWMYTLEHPHVKWMSQAGVNHDYAMIGRTLLATGKQLCTSMGGSVKVANNIVVGNDPMQFYSAKAGVDGFLGYMVTRTPIGKRSEEDNANYWTIIVDTENYSGPVFYISTWFWDALASWSPKSKTFGNPETLITSSQTGFEGAVGAFKVTDDDGTEWYKSNRIAVPQDEINGKKTDTSTFYTGYSTYATDWATDAMEPMLSGTGSSSSQAVSFINDSALADREQTPKCHAGPYELGTHWQGSFKFYHGSVHGPLPPLAYNMGIGDDFYGNFDWGKYDEESTAASCHTRFNLDKSKLRCKRGFCETYKYFKREKNSYDFVPMKGKNVPKNIKKVLNAGKFEPTKMNDGSDLGPPGEEEMPCFEKPGPAPADSRLYCTRLASGTWLGFKWYRFVDQPELNQVFASMDNSDRDAAKCYMQARIERLHEGVASGKGNDQWFSPPQGDNSLPKGKVSFDPGYLVTPPQGLEKGYVPITLWERNREVSDDCDVFLGEYNSEPKPFPEGYYDGHSRNGGGPRVRNQCPANKETNMIFPHPGTVYPYPFKDYSSPHKAYEVPLRENVGEGLNDNPVICNLASDP